MRYASLDALKDPIAYKNVKGFHSSKLPTVVGDENPIKIHLSLHLPKQSTNIEGNGKTISLMELWLSPILIPKFPSSSPSVPKETIDRTPRAREEKQLSSQFSLRVVEFVSFRVTCFFRCWVCLCTVFEFSYLFFSSHMFFPSPFPPLYRSVTLALSLCPFPPSCLSVLDPQISIYIMYPKSHAFSAKYLIWIPIWQCHDIPHSKSLDAGVRFYNRLFCMEWAPSRINGCAFPMGTPVTQTCRITPITTMGIREGSISAIISRLMLIAFLRKSIGLAPTS